jgi:hypothetical protein
MCADFVAPNFQNPDFLGSYIRGQQSGAQQAMLPQEMLQAQLQNTRSSLDIDQIRMAMKSQTALQNYGLQHLNDQSAQGDASNSSSSPGGGIQNGPQGSVATQTNRGGNGYSPDDYAGMIRNDAGYTPSAGSTYAMSLLGGNKMVEGIAAAQKLQMETRDAQMKVAQMKAATPISVMDALADSPNPTRMVMNNPDILARWPSIAQHMGFDPAKDFDDQHVRLAAIYGGNQIRTAVGRTDLRAMPAPLVNTNLGQGEVGQINALTGKKEGDLVERQTPGFTLVDKYDPNTGHTVKVPVQTSGYGMGGTNPNTGAPTGGAPPNGKTPGFDAGMKPPTDPELKAAMFGSEMRSGLNTLTRMESSGFTLSPKTRTLLINAATSEDEGALRQFTSQIMLKNMSPQEQTYVAALMPVLQAAGHDQSGARLTTSQVRQNIESLLPVDVNNKSAMDQVNANRKGFYNGLLSQAGPAAQLPQYRNTLGSDLKNAQQEAGNAPASAIAYLKAHPESAPHFKSKYGYLPNGG